MPPTQTSSQPSSQQDVNSNPFYKRVNKSIRAAVYLNQFCVLVLKELYFRFCTIFPFLFLIHGAGCWCMPVPKDLSQSRD